MSLLWFAGVAVVFCVAVSSGEDGLPWWRTAVLYQVYPRSFKDSDGDGQGDIRGITEMANHFKEIGADAIWLSPIYKSPMVDMGYDISNFTDIDPMFGVMDDFDALLARVKELGIKLMLDFVPNHTSDLHPWFHSSVNTEDPHHSDYRDFYVWRDPKGWYNETTPIAPNNWFSVFNGSAWEWCEKRKQFYLHQFRKEQPDLNYRNPAVVGNMTEVLNFWMDKGVDGFRVDAVPWLVEDANFTDDPPIPGTKGDSQDTQLHIYERNRPETYALLRDWADVVYKRTIQDGKDRAIMLELYESLDVTMRYYGVGNQSLEFPFNFLLMYLDQAANSFYFRWQINVWLSSMPAGGVANWVIGNHDQTRAANRFGPEMMDAMNMLTMVLPGVKVVYYGEEIAMRDTYIRPDQMVDNSIFSRDSHRTPMQWDDSVSAGFSSKPTTWLPVNPNYWWLNVAAQKTAETSHLKVFQAMTQIRKDPVFQQGFLSVLAPNRDLLVVIRYYQSSRFVLFVNVGSEVLTFTSKDFFRPHKLDYDMSVVVGSINSGYSVGVRMPQGSTVLTLRPKAAVLLRSSSTIPRLSFLAGIFMGVVGYFNR